MAYVTHTEYSCGSSFFRSFYSRDFQDPWKCQGLNLELTGCGAWALLLSYGLNCGYCILADREQ